METSTSGVHGAPAGRTGVVGAGRIRVIIALIAVATLFAAASMAWADGEVRTPPRELFGKNVLALYKSSDAQSEKDNEIAFHLQKALSEWGLQVRYYDIDSGIPSPEVMDGVRAVISWFRGPSMESPGAYLEFVNRTIDSGRKRRHG